MNIHREGYTILRRMVLVAVVLAAAAFVFLPTAVAWGVAVAAALCCLFVARFFREPTRPLLQSDGAVYAPADGRVVIVEPVEVAEYLGERRMQVSIFMSIWNVHVNWYPVGGAVAYYKYHPGKYLVAWHPKSSELNERTTTVVDTGHEKVLFRQIAGAVARRIVSYARAGERVAQNTQCGFIKFGSRVDLFLPLDAEILVQKGQKTVGSQTIVARLKR